MEIHLSLETISQQHRSTLYLIPYPNLFLRPKYLAEALLILRHTAQGNQVNKPSKRTVTINSTSSIESVLQLTNCGMRTGISF